MTTSVQITGLYEMKYCKNLKRDLIFN